MGSQPTSPRSAAQLDLRLLSMVEQTHRAPPPVFTPEAPEPRAVEVGFAAMARRVLGAPSPGYRSVVPERLRGSTEALAVLTDPQGHVGDAMLAKARAEGWLACVREHGETLASKRQGYGLGPLDGLLYRGAITPHEYWTASTLFALWRDSQGPSVPADATLREPGEPVAFGGRYVRWDSVPTFDLSIPEQRGQALSMGYALSPYTRMEHADSVRKAVAGWQRSPERFMYLLPLLSGSTYPWFGLVPFLVPLTPWKLHLDQDAHVPVFSLSLFQHDLNFFHAEPLTATPRLSTDPVSALQQQVLAGERAAGISHGFPWSGRSRHTHADFMATGEAGFAWHDLAHLSVGSLDPAEARRTLVQLHQALSAHCRGLELPERIGRFPFRKLFVARLFGLTDQSKTVLDLSVAAALEEHTTDVVGQALPNLLLSTNAAEAANVRRNFLRHLPADTVFHAALPEAERAAVNDSMPAHLTWQEDADLPRLASAWEHFTHLQLTHANGWLQERGHAVVATAQPDFPLAAVVTLRHPYKAAPGQAHHFNGAIALVQEVAAFGLRYRTAPFEPVSLLPEPFPPTGHWQHRGRQAA